MITIRYLAASLLSKRQLGPFSARGKSQSTNLSVMRMSAMSDLAAQMRGFHFV
jgi:hypothetical protein